MGKAVQLVKVPDRLSFAHAYLGPAEGERTNPLILIVKDGDREERIQFSPRESKRSEDGRTWVWFGTVPGHTTTDPVHHVRLECCFGGDGRLIYLEASIPEE